MRRSAMGHRFTWFEEQRGHRSANLSSLYADINDSGREKKLMKLSGSQLRIRSRSRNNVVRGNGAFLGYTVPPSSDFFLFFLSFFFLQRTRTLVAGEYYYSRLNSSSGVAGECEGRGAYIGRVKLEQRRDQIAGYRDRSRCMRLDAFRLVPVLTGSTVCVIASGENLEHVRFAVRASRVISLIRNRIIVE